MIYNTSSVICSLIVSRYKKKFILPSRNVIGSTYFLFIGVSARTTGYLCNFDLLFPVAVNYSDTFIMKTGVRPTMRVNLQCEINAEKRL